MSRSRAAWLVLAGVIASFGPVVCPEGLSLVAARLVCIFAATLLLVVLDVFPLGMCALMGLTATVLGKVLPFEQALSGYCKPTGWLILAAFCISHGFVRTGLGKRLACHLIHCFGRSRTGLAYAIALTDVLLAPAIPSATARSGGILFPIVHGLAETLDEEKEGRKPLAAYLMCVGFHSCVISSAMFLTAMAANPLAAQTAAGIGIELTWSLWALASFVPGVVSFALLPLVPLLLVRPGQTKPGRAQELARAMLTQMGPMRREEKGLLVVFFLLVALWISGSWTGVSAVAAALLGVCLLVAVGLLPWKEIAGLAGAWETFLWFGAFLSFADNLSHSGAAGWFSQWVAESVAPLPAPMGLVALCLLYFYAHYLLGSSTAHVGALYLPFLLASVSLGARQTTMALLLAQLGALSGCLTHYSFGPAPIWFGAGFLSLRRWCLLGFVFSLCHLLVWGGVGSLWQRFLQTGV